VHLCLRVTQLPELPGGMVPIQAGPAIAGSADAEGLCQQIVNGFRVAFCTHVSIAGNPNVLKLSHQFT